MLFTHTSKCNLKNFNPLFQFNRFYVVRQFTSLWYSSRPVAINVLVSWDFYSSIRECINILFINILNYRGAKLLFFILFIQACLILRIFKMRELQILGFQEHLSIILTF